MGGEALWNNLNGSKQDSDVDTHYLKIRDNWP